MTTKKDLVEAHQFSRRRLVTAFLSGAPGGREVEPARPGRTIVGGVAIAVLLIAGGAIAAVLKPKAPEGWESQGLIVTDRGARYVVTQDKGELRPVVNLTSAQLILGLDAQAQVVSQKTVDKSKTPGPPIGIENAPEELPTEDHFIESGWTACTANGAGIDTDLSRSPQVETSGRGPSDTGFLVQTPDHTMWLIAESIDPTTGSPVAYRYELPASVADTLAPNLFSETAPPRSVSDAWIDLFPAGTDLSLKAFPRGHWNLISSGDKEFLDNGTSDVQLDAFPAAVYSALAHQSARPGQPSGKSLTMTTTWPRNQLSPPTNPVMCAQLVTAAGSPPVARIGTPKAGGDAWPTTADDQPKAADPPVQSVDPGMGAFVYSGTFPAPTGGATDGGSTASSPPGGSTTAYVVDSRGYAFQLTGGSTIQSLHLDTYKAPVVPDTWIKVLGSNGTALSTEQALCPPSTEPKKGSSECAPAAQSDS